MVNGNGSKFSQWMSSGLLATVTWFIVLITYCTFRAFGIEDPIIGQVFLLLTGLWVGNLTLAQGKKQAKVEETAVAAQAAVAQVARQVGVLVEDVDTGAKRADHAEMHVEILKEQMVTEQQRNTLLEGRADVSETRANHSEVRADDSETRETEWSQHKDHQHGDDE